MRADEGDEHSVASYECVPACVCVSACVCFCVRVFLRVCFVTARHLTVRM